MRIGCFVPVASVLRGYERNVSGHVQVPMGVMRVLVEAGHEVHLITNKFGPDRVLPWCVPDAVTPHFVRDSRRRLGSLEKKGAKSPSSGVYPVAFMRQLMEVKRIARDNRLDILHFNGHSRSAQLGGILKLVGLKTPTVAYLSAAPVALTAMQRMLLRKVGPLITGTDYATEQCRRFGLDATTIRHGVIRDFSKELPEGFTAERNRVLFWRDLTRNNGADLCLKAYEELAPAFPDVLFTIAVRPNQKELTGVEQVVDRHPNIQLYRFPYPPGVSLAQLVSESICIVLPFRRLTIDPQLSIAESLAVGVPVIASDLEANGELVQDGLNGRLVPVGDAEATTAALRDVLSDRGRALEMGRNAAREFARTWTWDGYVAALEGVYQRSIIGRRHSSLEVVKQ